MVRLEDIEALLNKALEISSRQLVPSIEDVDGSALMAVSFLYTSALRGEGSVIAIDAGAGVGYSTLWIAFGLEQACKTCDCKVYAVEKNPVLVEHLAELANEFNNTATCVRIQAVNNDAVEFINSLQSESVDIIFVDVDKQLYTRILDAAREKLRPGGILAFHNYRVPRPPSDFYKALEGIKWPKLIVPSLPGLLILYKPKRL